MDSYIHKFETINNIHISLTVEGDRFYACLDTAREKLIKTEMASLDDAENEFNDYIEIAKGNKR